uniref:Uncharacterized protein n=1 Tax=Magallana gigas TaxID=29159 RepID=K1QHF4_MAGGI
MSESVFVRMCQIVGTSQLVAIRRETWDFRETLERRIKPNDGVIEMMSGSEREGFRWIGSDVDFMYWRNNHRVIMDMSQSEHYTTANTTLILSDSSESPPGFTLLQLLTPTKNIDVHLSCVKMNDRVYISSSIHRQLTCSDIFPNSTVHGPCGSGVRAGVEYDHAHCFVCDFWPPAASSWINRCHSWPDPEVANDIVRNGCHIVAIGHPLGPNENESSSIRSYIIDVLYNPRLSLCTDESILRCEVDCDLELFDKESFRIDSDIQITGGILGIIKTINLIEQLVESPLTQYQVWALQKCTVISFMDNSFLLCNIYTNTGVNKQIYIAEKMFRYMLKLAAKFGCVSDMLFIAMYYYKTLRYREALSVIEMTKVKLAQPYLMYMKHVDRERYTEAVGGQSWSTKMRQAVAVDIKLNNGICYISELILEQQSALQNRDDILDIPVFVMLHFLEFLCYRHIDTTLSQAALDELQVLVHHDRGRYVGDIFRDISWEILGICQQITGNLQVALYSYQQSLAQYPWNDIQTATQRRIQDIIQPNSLE